MTETETSAVEQPVECGHKSWTLGCERCFYEMYRLAKKEAQVSNTEAIIEGATLFNCHILLLLADLEVQLTPDIRSLDLRRVDLAKTLIANLRQISDHLVRLVSDHVKLTHALNTAARFAQTVYKQQDAAVPPPAPAGNSIVLTDI